MQYLNLSTSLLLILFITPMLTLSSKSLIMLWILIEMNNMAFIYLFILNNKNMSYMSMNFFLVQTISSLTILIFLVMNNKSTLELMKLEMNLILLMGLLMKMSLPPFHMWMIKLSKIATWNTNMMFITWQKIIPILIMIKFQNYLLILVSMLFLLMGIIIQLSFTKIKSLIVSSSIVHMGWMIIPQNSYKIFPYVYMILYALIIIPLISLFKKTNKWKLMSMKQKNNFIMMMNIFNLSGIPPFTGFLLKWMTFSLMIQQKMNMIYMFILFAIASISFFIYFQIMNNIMFKTFLEKKTKLMSKMDNQIVTKLVIMNLPFMFFM